MQTSQDRGMDKPEALSEYQGSSCTKAPVSWLHGADRRDGRGSAAFCLGGQPRTLSELPRLHLNRVDVEIGNVDVSHFQPFGQRIARIKA
jgi:hypothetical protein